MTSREFQDRLARCAVHSDVPLSPSLSVKLETYFRLLSAWNRKINLTGLDLTDPAPEVLERLLLEPVAAAVHLPRDAKRVIDVGSGGGSPAIPMALAAPWVRLTMVESKSRKAVFLREAVRAVELVEAEVLTTRFEALSTLDDFRGVFDVVSVRAVRVDPEIVGILQSFVRPSGLVFIFVSTAQAPIPVNVAATFPLVGGSRLVVARKTAGSL